MTTVQSLEYHGSTLLGSSPLFLARLERQFSEKDRLLLPEDIDAIEYTVYRVEPTESARTAVAGHTQITLNVEEVILATPATDAYWPDDQLGYNFKHRIDQSTQAAFSGTGHYQVEYAVTPYAEPTIVLRYRLHVT